MDYIPGFDLTQVLEDRATVYFHPDTMKGYTPKGLPHLEVMGNSLFDFEIKESPLVILGKMIGSDILLNNPDRVPTIWPNSGNASNIMFEIQIDPSNYAKDFLLTNPLNVEKMNLVNLVAIDNKSFSLKA